MRMGIRTWLTVFALSTVPTPDSQSATSPNHDALDTPIKIYSNICMSRESGDLVGYQLVLHDWGRVLLFQETEGWLGPTQVTNFKLSENKIMFSINVSFEGRARTVGFAGTITKDAVVGTFDDESPYLSGTMTFEARPNKFPNVPGCTDSNYPFSSP